MQNEPALRLRKMIRWPDVLARIPLSYSTIKALIKQGRFPKPFPLTASGHSTAFYLDEIEAWQQEREGTDQPLIERNNLPRSRTKGAGKAAAPSPEQRSRHRPSVDAAYYQALETALAVYRPTGRCRIYRVSGLAE